MRRTSEVQGQDHVRQHSIWYSSRPTEYPSSGGPTRLAMHPSSRITSSIVGCCVLGLSPLPAMAADDYAFFHENVMGTSLELRLRADSVELAERAEDRVLRSL